MRYLGPGLPQALRVSSDRESRAVMNFLSTGLDFLVGMFWYGRSIRSARGQACLLLGCRRVVAATGAGGVARFAGGVFEVGCHGGSPVCFLSVTHSRLRLVWRGIECDQPSMEVSIQNGTGKDTERSRTHLLLQGLGRKMGVFAIFHFVIYG